VVKKSQTPAGRKRPAAFVTNEDDMAAIEIKKDLYWVGAVDWNIRDFHGYSTDKGTSYNAYLIKDEKIALFDTVKKEVKGDLIHHLRQVLGDPEQNRLHHRQPCGNGSLRFPAGNDHLIKPEKIFARPWAEGADRAFSPGRLAV
jgi:hypothetical protein